MKVLSSRRGCDGSSWFGYDVLNTCRQVHYEVWVGCGACYVFFKVFAPCMHPATVLYTLCGVYLIVDTFFLLLVIFIMSATFSANGLIPKTRVLVFWLIFFRRRMLTIIYYILIQGYFFTWQWVFVNRITIMLKFAVSSLEKQISLKKTHFSAH